MQSTSKYCQNAKTQQRRVDGIAAWLSDIGVVDWTCALRSPGRGWLRCPIDFLLVKKEGSVQDGEVHVGYCDTLSVCRLCIRQLQWAVFVLGPAPSRIPGELSVERIGRGAAQGCLYSEASAIMIFVKHTTHQNLLADRQSAYMSQSVLIYDPTDLNMNTEVNCAIRHALAAGIMRSSTRAEQVSCGISTLNATPESPP